MTKAFWIPLLAALTVSPAIAAQAQSPRPSNLLEQAEQAAEDRSPDGQRRAAELFEAAAEAALDATDPQTAAAALHRAGWALLRAGDLDAAIEVQERCLPLARQAADAELTVKVYDAIAYAHYRAGRRRQALAALEAGLAAARRAEKRELEAGMLNNIASVYSTWDQDQQALDHYRRAADIYRELENDELLASTLNNLSSVYLRLGEVERAAELRRAALGPARASDDAGLLASVLGNLGSISKRLGDLDAAESYYREAVEIRRRQGDGNEAVPLHNLADLLLTMGRPQDALPLLIEAEALVRERDNNLLLSDVLVGRGRAEHALGRSESALEQLAAASAIAEESERAQDLAVVDRVTAEVLSDLGRLKQAEQHVTSAIEAWEVHRAELLSERLRGSALGAHRPLYELWIDILLARHQLEPDAGHDRRAFAASEKARARSILELFAGLGEPEDEAALTRELSRLDAATSDLQRRLRDRVAAGAPPEEVTELEAELEALARKREILDEETRRAAHDAADVLSVEAKSLESIQAALPPATALFEFFLGENGSVLFVVSNEGMSHYRLPARQAIDDLVERLRDSLATPSRRALTGFRQTAHALYRELLAGAEADLAGVELLLIAADGPLHGLPFGALLTRASDADPAQLPYLLRGRDVAYVPSGTVLAHLAAGTVSARGDGTLVVADPAQVGGDSALEGEAAERRGARLRGVFGPDRSWAPGPLPSARREADGIREIIGGEAVTVLAGAEATEENLKASPELRRSARLHFATHALVSEREPTYSGLVLALDERGEEDGLLQVYEIAELNLAAELVVLSACETGLGREVRGEGLVGLTQAFFAAGAESLVVSLWSVADESTADLMLGFYRALAEDAGRATALRRAKLTLAGSERFAHPYYWAPFVLQGLPH